MSGCDLLCFRKMVSRIVLLGVVMVDFVGIVDVWLMVGVLEIVVVVNVVVIILV